MDFKDLIKFQMMSHTTTNTGQSLVGGVATLQHTIFQMIMMLFVSLIDDIAKAIPKLVGDAKSVIKQKLSSQVEKTLSEVNSPTQLSEQAISLNTRHKINKFVMFRCYSTSGESEKSNVNETTSEETNGMVDACLAFVAKLHNVPKFNLINKGNIMVGFTDMPIQITRDIFFKIDNITFTPSGSVQSIKFTLMSNTVSASDITTFAKNIYQNWLLEMKNSLGNNLYFFDQKGRESSAPSMPPTNSVTDILNHKRMLVSTAPKQLSFTMSPFYSNKKFANIFGKDVREIERRVRFFLDNRDWYDAKGVPYQLGILLSGEPGTGKSSIIKAIANLTKRHIVNVNFANITTASQLKNMFYSDKIQTFTDQSLANTHSYFIPIDQRIYVLEEIDTLGEIVCQRVYNENKGAEDAIPTVNDELTLGEILTVLDGTMEIPGRIIIMTTNHHEILDRALIRPGRIDVHTHFKLADRELILEMFKAYMEHDIKLDLHDKIPEYALSPAEVGQVLFRFFGTSASDAEIVAEMIRTSELKNTKTTKITTKTNIDLLESSKSSQSSPSTPTLNHPESPTSPISKPKGTKDSSPKKTEPNQYAEFQDGIESYNSTSFSMYQSI